MRHRALPILISSLVAAIAILVGSPLARADEPLATGELAWNSNWTKFRPIEYALTGAAGIASIGVYFYVEPPDEPKWTGGILFDDAARSALRVRSPGALRRIRFMSDVTALSAAVFVVGVDSLIVPLVRGKSDIAAQLVLMDAEAFAFSTLITTSTFNTVGRARPSYADCQRDPSFDPLCNSGPISSFPSGHANASATAAGLSCAHHMHLAIYGNRIADAIACGTTVALSLSTSTFRVMGDRHYVTDVLVGSAIGFSIGFGAPTLLHYAGGGEAKTPSITLTPLGGAQYGLLASGVF